MPNPEGSKLLYIKPEIAEKFPQLGSVELQDALAHVDDWTAFITFKGAFRQYLADHKDIERALKALRVIS